MKLCVFMIVAFLVTVPFTAVAEDAFDGTKPLLCASIEAHDCAPGEQCDKGLPEEIGAPQFMRIDFTKKEIIGPKRTTQIRSMEKDDDQITLQGFELGMGWALTLDRSTGKMTVTLAGREAAFVIFGACTSIP